LALRLSVVDPFEPSAARGVGHGAVVAAAWLIVNCTLCPDGRVFAFGSAGPRRSPLILSGVGHAARLAAPSSVGLFSP